MPRQAHLRVLAQALAAIGGGAVINVSSIANGVNSPQLAICSVSKADSRVMVNGLRHELREQGTQMLGMRVGFVDTDLTQGWTSPRRRQTSLQLAP